MESKIEVKYGRQVCDKHSDCKWSYRETEDRDVFRLIIKNDYSKLLKIIKQMIDDNNEHEPGTPFFPCWSLQYADNAEMANFIITIAATPCFSYRMCNYSRMVLRLLPQSTTHVALSNIEAALNRTDWNAVEECIDIDDTLPYTEYTWKEQQQFLNDRLVRNVLIGFIRQRSIEHVTRLKFLPRVLLELCGEYIGFKWKDISKKFYRSSLHLPPKTSF